jgi:hypothetical protein
MTESGTFKINELAGETILAGSHNFFARFSNYTDEGMRVAAKRSVAAFSLRLYGELPYALQHRYGLSRDADLSWAPILEDSLSWWDAMEDYARGYLALYYPSPGSAAADPVLRAWHAKILEICAGASEYSSLEAAGAAGADVEELVRLATIQIWNGSVQHEILGNGTWRTVNPFESPSMRWRTPRTKGGNLDATLGERVVDKWAWVRSSMVATPRQCARPRWLWISATWHSTTLDGP